MVGIYAHDKPEEIKLKTEFLTSLWDSFSTLDLNNVDIVLLKNHISEKLVNSKDINTQILKINHKIKAHYYLTGDIRKTKDGEDIYFIRMNGLVTHEPLDAYIKDELKTEFIKIIPTQFRVRDEFAFSDFKISAEAVSVSVKYIVGLAAFFSGYPVMAHNLHSDLEQKIKNSDPLAASSLLMLRLNEYMLKEELIISYWYYLRKDLPESRSWMKKALDRDSDNYGVWIRKGLLDYLDGDTDDAFASIFRAKDIAKSMGIAAYEWQYSLSFLYFWTKDYKEALIFCSRIFRRNLYNGEDRTIQEVIEFTNEQIEKHPKEVQLIFWLGYIYYIQGNNPMALRTLEGFEQKSDKSMTVLVEKSTRYLAEIKQEMNILDRENSD